MIRMASFTGRLRGNRGQHAAASLRDPRRLPAGPAAGDGDLDAREREIIAAWPACKTAPNGTGARCTCSFDCANYWLRAARQGRVSWVPKPGPRPAALTAPMPVAPARPYVPETRGISPLDRGTPVWPGVRPVIGDSMPPLPPESVPEPGPVSVLPDSVPYCGPGWAGHLMSMRVRDGEWEELDLIVERGWGRNAAEEAAQRRHSRERLPRYAWELCAALGEPERAAELVHRVREFGAAAAAGGAR